MKLNPTVTELHNPLSRLNHPDLEIVRQVGDGAPSLHRQAHRWLSVRLIVVLPRVSRAVDTVHIWSFSAGQFRGLYPPGQNN